MTSILTCRLLESKALPRSEVAQALRESCARGIALVQALMERVPEVSTILEYEYQRWLGPRQSSISTDVALVRQLPLGMCERLLVLPLERAHEDDPVPLAVVDPFDVHAMAEFRYCLGLAVTPVRVHYDLFIQELDAVRHVGQASAAGLMDAGDDHTPAFGVRALGTFRRRNRQTRDFSESSRANRQGFTLPPLEAPGPSSEPPLPLLRTTLAPQRSPGASSEPTFPLVRGTLAPPTYPTAPTVVRAGSTSRDSEPVLTLVKQKPAGRALSMPAPAHPPAHVSESPNLTLSRLEEAESAAQLLDLLQSSLSSTAPCQAHFSVQKGRFAPKWSSSGVHAQNFELTAEQEGVLLTACQVGYFLGPLPPDGKVLGLGHLLGMRPREELYVAPVTVKNRAVLVVVVGRFDDAFAITRWVDALVLRAGQVLERLMLAKKQT